MTADTPSTPHATTHRRLWHRLSRGLLWLVLGVWTLFLLTLGALHFWIVPRIADWRGDLERWASQALGQPVQIGDVRALPSALPDWLPVPPALAVSDVRVIDQQGQVALSLPQVQVSVSLSSLWRWGFEQLVIEGPELQVRRLPNGRITVAGQDMAAQPSGDTRVAEWLLAQREVVIRHGTVRWTDDLLRAPPLALTDVQIRVGHRGRRHDWQIDAVPPAEWGQPFALRAELFDPLLPWQRAEQPVWLRWQGQVVAEFPAVDIQHLRHHIDGKRWGMDWRAGVGSLVLKTELRQGLPEAVQARLGLRDVDVRLGQGLEPLRLRSVQGPLRLERTPARWRVQSDGLALQMDQEPPWTGGRWDWGVALSEGGTPQRVSLEASDVDLGRLSDLAERLPIGADALRTLRRLQPAGVLQRISGEWTAPMQADTPWWRGRYRVEGELRGLALASEPSGQISAYGPFPVPGRPGISGAGLRFVAHDQGGEAELSVRDGALDLPGVFEDSRLPLQRLNGRLRWATQGDRIDVWADEVTAANADAEGKGHAHWHTTAGAAGRDRFPGTLDLNASLSRANVGRTHRYLPLSVSPDARRYVREAVRGGSATRVDFRMRGQVHDMPFHDDAMEGEFRIRADLRDVGFDYVPGFLTRPGVPRWPALTQLSGELQLDRVHLGVTGIRSGFDGLPGVVANGAEVHIRRLDRHTPVKLEVQAPFSGNTAAMLGFVQQSPVGAWLGGALSQTTLAGNGKLDLSLLLPFDRLAQSEVKGALRLDGNELRPHPLAPPMSGVRGELQFTQASFAVRQVRANTLGGEVRIDGGWTAGDAGPAFKVEGRASVDGLRAWAPPATARWLDGASGQTAYRAQIGFVRGELGLDIRSDLQGLALPLPAPLGKRADASVPWHLQRTVATPDAASDRWSLDWGQGRETLRVRYDRALETGRARVLRGAIAVGPDTEAMPDPASGVQAQIQLARLAVSDWQRWLGADTGLDMRTLADADAPLQRYLPDQLSLRTEALEVEGRRFERVVMGAVRQGRQWRANVDAPEVGGYVELRLAPDGAVQHWRARLAKLHLPASTAGEADRLARAATDLPGVDLVVDDFRLGPRALGRLELNAEPSGSGANREWRLNTLQLHTPEANLRATGNWAVPVALGNGPSAPRRTQLGVQLDIEDSGELLTRFGHPGTVRGAKGRLEGQIGWLGTPFQPDWASATGQLRLEVERGQFLKADPGVAKLLGVLNLQALPRRLALDFRDVFSEGFAFDFVRGDARIERGVVGTNNLQMKGVNAAVLMEGRADIVRETQDVKAVVVPEVNAGTASLIATAINPAVGLGTFLAQFLLNQPLQSAATQTFHITGTWSDPKIDKLTRSEPTGASAPDASR